MCEAINLRAATEADLEYVLHIEQQSATAAHWAIGTYRVILSADPAAQPQRALFVGERDGEIVGFAVVRALLVLGHGPECELENIAVSPQARRGGVATALVQRVSDWARAHGADQLGAEVRETNTAALRLYGVLGFKPTSKRKKYYSDPDEDAEVLTLHL